MRNETPTPVSSVPPPVRRVRSPQERQTETNQIVRRQREQREREGQRDSI